jgi:hypothetical protein
MSWGMSYPVFAQPWRASFSVAQRPLLWRIDVALGLCH